VKRHNMANTDAILELEKKRDEFLSNAKALDIAISILRGSALVAPAYEHQAMPDVAYVSPVTNQVVMLEAKEKPNLRGTGVIARAIAIIKHAGRFVSRNEIENLASQYGHPFKGSIASALSSDKNRDESELAIMKVGGTGNGNSVWGLKSWVIDGEIAPGREPLETNS
jgi:hypothetical protein